MSVRVYLPSTLPRLRALLGTAGLGAEPWLAHGVTDAVRRELEPGGDEECEYAAAAAAAQASLALLQVGDPARRVVLAVDVPSVLDAGDEDVTLVRVPHAVPLAGVAAVLADSADAENVVAAAREALRSADPGRERRLERCLHHELGWWAAQEIEDLLAEAAVG